MPAQRDQIRGSFLGLAWGDAFGSPVEGWQPETIRAVFGDYLQLPDEYPLGRITPLGKKVLQRLRPLGLHSDDTQQAMALINVCLSGWSPEAWAEWLVAGRKKMAWRGYGRNFAAAVGKMAKGKPPRQTGTPTAGVGAAMRSAPLGALYRDDPERLAQVAMESSLCTHGDIRAAALAFAIAHAASALIAGQTPDQVRAGLPAVVAAREREWVHGHEDWTFDRSAGLAVSRCLEEFFAEDLHDPERIRARISELARPHLARGFTRAHPNQGFVLLGGLHGLVMALIPEEDPGKILAEIVAQGFDTDTVAAICGGLLGARYGTGWIPLHRLRDRARLEDYADALVERQGPPEDRATFLEREADWTKQEAAYQKTLAATAP
ncbi:MAG TPA: ADP-ribosylglycohydrolase family protein [Gemmataceae bacterium]|nr:ADP-ribosylglycohydrolase family protein [Gemmataceae bacterium]